MSCYSTIAANQPQFQPASYDWEKVVSPRLSQHAVTRISQLKLTNTHSPKLSLTFSPLLREICRFPLENHTQE
jgi:hypothetical protein